MTTFITDIRDLSKSRLHRRLDNLSKLLKDYLGIVYFSHERVDEKGNYSVFMNNLDYFDYFIDEKIYLDDAYLISPHHYQPGRSICLFDTHLNGIE